MSGRFKRNWGDRHTRLQGVLKQGQAPLSKDVKDSQDEPREEPQRAAGRASQARAGIRVGGTGLPQALHAIDE